MAKRVAKPKRKKTTRAARLKKIKKKARAPKRKKPSRARLDAANKSRAERSKAKKRQAATARKKRKARAITLAEKLRAALQHMKELAADIGFRSTLDVEEPESQHDYEAGDDDGSGQRRNEKGEFVWKTPWCVIGKFIWRKAISYADLYAILKRWTRRSVERKVGADRMARMRVEYEHRGKADDYILAETLAWTHCLGRAMQECDPSDERSLAARYSTPQRHNLIVWLSHESQRGAVGITLIDVPTKPKAKAKKKKRK